MTGTWALVVVLGLVGLSSAYEGRALSDTAWWSAPEPQWRSRLLPALMPAAASQPWAAQAQYRQLDQQQQPQQHHQQQQQQHHQQAQPQQQHQARAFYQPQPYHHQQQQQQQQFQPYYPQQQQQQQQLPAAFYPQQQQQQQVQRARYLREPQDDPYRGYNPRQPAPWSVQVGTSLSVRDDDSRGSASRRYYVQSQRDHQPWQ